MNPDTCKLPDSYLEWRANLQKRQERPAFTTMQPTGEWYTIMRIDPEFPGLCIWFAAQVLHRECEYYWFYDPISRKRIIRHQCELGPKLTRTEKFMLVNDDYRK